MNPDLQGEAISPLAGVMVADRDGDLTTPFHTDEAALHIDTV